MTSDGEVDGVVVTFSDVAERIAAQASLRAAYDHERLALAKLQELDDAKSNFLATVSHELRTPLTSLTGYLELFAEGDVGEVTERQRRIIATMSRNADRLRALIEDLLMVSNVEAAVRAQADPGRRRGTDRPGGRAGARRRNERGTN